jgi:CubicO group peptidase (beta-lactamase class C family)
MRRTAVLLAVAALVACSGDDTTAPAASTAPSGPSAATAPTTAGSPPSGSATTAVPGVGTPDSSPAPASSDAPASVPAATAPGEALPPPPGYPAQPAGVPFPDGDWATAPLPDWVDQAALDAAVAEAIGPADQDNRVRAVVVVHGGAIVYERYHPRSGPDEVQPSYSVAKSFLATIVGQLVDDGVLDLDTPVERPEWPEGDARRTITLRQLLQMSSGLEWDEVSSLASMGFAMLASPSAAAVMANQPLEREPGTAFEYSTGTSALIAGIAADALGGCAALDAHLRGRLLDPIGITTADVTTDGGGCFVGGLGMNMTPRDFARFGLLNLRGGWWDGTQVVRTEWIDAERTPSPTNPQYGLHWWLGETGAEFAAIGFGGQQVAVFPSADLVVVVNSAIGNDQRAAALVAEIAGLFGARS